ncbi:7-cyano-7-deazaguanine synthase [Aquamicrobium defluvii]|uniref:7-cyano-7-deazaguanine synthase n=1 Tax=Aquamicrobium defluvii TaxID=69279 RepID=A0A4V3DJW8_9HYPH|nr:7-cyano-7-deazaguanine synthase [Aquamicrobium defluvii]TDR31777.1 queuosine biosynthesis protein QueC [Aquamicrobium defluvii]
MKRFFVECGVSQPSGSDAIAMDVHGDAKNVNLRIDYISRTMLGNVPDLLIDLLELAAYIYCADQRLGRGSDKLTNFGENWRRSLHFSVPVRQLEIWQNPEVHEVLAGTLGFLSDDSYEFDFRRAETPVQPKELYFPHLIDASAEHDEVALFSGGIDSFAGVVNDVVTLGKSITLVGHYSSSKVRNVQESLIEGLSQKGFDRRISYIPVWVSNQGVSAREFTQRTRSFLFACLGLVVARMSGKDRFSFYENGVISINPPLAGDVIGGRATRTTHPKVLRGLEALFSILLDHQIEIQTPLHWLTKKEVTQKIKEADMSDMLGQTVSCTRPRIWTERQKHCGVCSQCIDRRFAVLAAGMEDHEPSSNYMRDLLLGDRSADDDLRMALSYVSFFQKVAATPKERFLVDFPEVVSALDQFPGLSPDDAGERIYNLFQRHAKAVEDVITAAISEHGARLYRNELPSGSLLATCFSRGHVEAAPAPDYDAQAKAFIDRLSSPILDFAFDEAAKRVLFHGGHHLDGANFRVVAALIENFREAKRQRADVPFFPATELADRLGVSDQSMRQQLGRLRKTLEPLTVTLGIPLDQDSFVQTKERAGYRLNPEWREVSVGDIRVKGEVTSQA